MNQQTYLKMPFVWEEPQPLVNLPSRLKFESANALSNEQWLSIVGRVMSSSLDAGDRKAVTQYGAFKAAQQFLESSKDGFSYQNEWWQVGFNPNGEIVGFVLPVIFEGCAKDGLEEGTIYYIGVLPEYRGFGFANDLLLQGTRILQEIGVWRVFCDTDVNNFPMIAAFRRVGYRQYSEPWERPL